MNVAAPHIFEVQRHIQEDVQTFLNTDSADITDEVRLAEFEIRIRRHRFESLQIGSVSNNENVARILTTPGDSEISVAAIRRHDHIAEAISLVLEPNLGLVKEVPSFIFGEIQFRVRVVMIKNVFDAQEFEREGYQENIVGGITALNDLKPVPKIDPPGVEELPEKCAAEFDKITEGAVPFFGHWMSIDMHVVENFVPRRIALAARTQYGDLEAVLMQGEGFCPHASVAGNGEVFDDNQDFVFHAKDLL